MYATLETNGSLNAIKARIRADIYAALDTHSPPANQQPAQPSNANLIINELLREYLAYNNLTHTLSTLLVEANQPAQPPFERHFLMGELGIAEAEVGSGSGAGARVPLLYGVVAAMRGEVKERREKEREEKFATTGKEEATVLRPAGSGASHVQQQAQRGSMGSVSVEEKGSVRLVESTHRPPHQPQHRSYMSI